MKNYEKLHKSKKIVLYCKPRARKKKDSQPGVRPPYMKKPSTKKVLLLLVGPFNRHLLLIKGPPKKRK